MNSHLIRCSALSAVVGLLGSAPAMAAHPVPRMQYLQKSTQAGTQTDKKLVFEGNQITVPVVAVAPASPDKTFEIHGKVNPTIILPAGAKVRFKLGNADAGMPHGLAVTSQSPPYPDNVRQKIKPPLAGTGFVEREKSKTHLQVAETGWFELKPGTYYYVCPVPAHARNGMYGKIIVKASDG